MKNDDSNAGSLKYSGLGDLETQARQGKLDRREFIKRAAALGIAAPFATSLLSQSVQAATPKKGGKMIMGLGYGSTTDSLIPGANENGFLSTLSYAFQNQLTEIDNNGRTIPELAESFEANDDATKWVFKLRQGVEFHNGKTMTADDVSSCRAIRRSDWHAPRHRYSAGLPALNEGRAIRRRWHQAMQFFPAELRPVPSHPVHQQPR